MARVVRKVDLRIWMNNVGVDLTEVSDPMEDM